MKYIILTFLVGSAWLLGYTTADAQAFRMEKSDRDSILYYEQQLMHIADTMYEAPIAEMRQASCEHFIRTLVKALKLGASYSHSFDSLQQKINIIYPEDKSFRIFSWQVRTGEAIRRYYGTIQMATKDCKLYPLFDISNDIGGMIEDTVLTGGKWIGATYYNILTKNVNGEKVYHLIGLNSAALLSNRKLIDPMLITEKGPQFGLPVFAVNSEIYANKRIVRFVIEYKKEAQAKLNYDKEIDGILLDKLVSQVNDPHRKYTYVPSGQYDGLKWNNNQWNYMQDIMPILDLKDGEAPVPQPKTFKQE